MEQPQAESSLESPGRLGVWASVDAYSAPQAADFAQRIEALGYSALWIPEAVGREPFPMLGYLGAKTTSLILATGIANIYARDAVSLRAIHQTLGEMLPGRFILGLGVSHPHLVTRVRGHEWLPPVAKMRDTLTALREALYLGPKPEQEAPIVIAALRPKMMALAGEMTRGAHPYLVTPQHTVRAREILGVGPWLCPEQMVILETDPEKARAVARKNLVVYLRAPNYQNSLKEIGFKDDDFQDGGSHRLVDALVAWGDEDALRGRIEEHWQAGADHVCIQPFKADGTPGPDLKALELLAPLSAA